MVRRSDAELLCFPKLPNVSLNAPFKRLLCLLAHSQSTDRVFGYSALEDEDDKQRRSHDTCIRVRQRPRVPRVVVTRYSRDGDARNDQCVAAQCVWAAGQQSKNAFGTGSGKNIFPARKKYFSPPPRPRVGCASCLPTSREHSLHSLPGVVSTPQLTHGGRPARCPHRIADIGPITHNFSAPAKCDAFIFHIRTNTMQHRSHHAVAFDAMRWKPVATTGKTFRTLHYGSVRNILARNDLRILAHERFPCEPSRIRTMSGSDFWLLCNTFAVVIS